MAGLKDGPDRNRELLAADAALPDTPMLEALAFQPVWLALRLAAMRANDPIRPTDSLQVFRSRYRIKKALVCQR
jgi:hypothetical protein